MKFPCSIEKTGETTWFARHDGPQAGKIEVRAATRDEALEKMKNEIRYRLELCPCTGETYQYIDVEIVDEPAKA